MSQQTTTISTPGSNAYTAPSTLLNGSVSVTVYGAHGGNTPGGPNGGASGRVVATVTVAAGGALTAVVGDASTHGQHTGAAGSAGSGGGVTGQTGGGSSAILAGATLLLEAGGGGGAGGGGLSSDATGGAGGTGGLTFGHGANGAQLGALGTYRGGGGGGGGGHQGNGSGGISTSTGLGGTLVGQGGDSAVNHTNTEAGGGGGAGGSSYAAASGVSGVVFTDGIGTGPASITIVATVADAPLAPTLTSPANGAYVDSNGAGVTFTWTYNPASGSGTQTAYALRVLISGAYQYWNATSVAFQAGIVWNASTGSSVAVPAGKLADGVSYNWSIATQESYYSLQGPFASDLLFNANAEPTATITSPSGTISSAAPTVTWSETLGGGDVQTAFRVVIYTAAVAGGGGFSPGVTTGTVDSGVVSSAALSWSVPGGTPLAQGNWVVYLQITETGSIVSQWASSSFTVAYDPPAQPTLSGVVGTDPTTAMPTVTLTVTALDNLLSTDDGSFEATLGTWTAGANTTAAQSTAQAQDGTGSMSLTATASGSVVTSTSATVYAVTGGNTYAAMASFRAGATARSCTVAVAWYNASNTLISTSTSGSATDSTSAWTEASLTATAPGAATHAQITVTVAGCAASEVHYVDEVGLFLAGAVPAWSRGGLVGIQLASIVYSDNAGATWLPLRNATLVAVPSSTEQVTVVDYEAPFGPSRQYRATISANVTTPVAGTVTSVPSAAYTGTVPSGPWWLTDPLDPTTALQISRVATSGGSSTMQGSSGGAAQTSVKVPVSFEKDSAEQMGIFFGWGNPNPIIQRGTVLAPSFVTAGYIAGYTQYSVWQSLTGRIPMSNGQIRQRTLLLRSDMGDAWYVVVGPGLADQLLRSPDRVSNPQWIVTIPCVVTSKP